MPCLNITKILTAALDLKYPKHVGQVLGTEMTMEIFLELETLGRGRAGGVYRLNRHSGFIRSANM